MGPGVQDEAMTMRAMRILPTVMGFAALCALTMPAHAEVYKWTDTDGVVRYGQLPPPGVQTQTIGSVNSEAMPAEAAGATKPGPQAQDEEQLERIRAEQAGRDAKRKAEADEYCARARAELQKLDENPPNRLASVNESGERVRMTQEQYDASRQQIQAGIDQHCH